MKDCLFPTDKCPLCGAKLDYTQDRTEFKCPTPPSPQIQNLAYTSHYEIVLMKWVQDWTSFQNITIFPYFFQSTSRLKKTNVHTLDPWNHKEFISLPMITDWSQPDKIIERVKILIPFL